MQQTLVLNADFRPIEIVDWQKAICYVFKGKADIVAETGQIVRSISMELFQPLVIRLRSYCRQAFGFRGLHYSRANLLFRDNMQCQYCSKALTKATATVDHVVPRSKGGKDTWENTVIACLSCNQRKGDKTLQQAGMRPLKSLHKLTLTAYLNKKGFDWS